MRLEEEMAQQRTENAQLKSDMAQLRADMDEVLRKIDEPRKADFKTQGQKRAKSKGGGEE